MGCTIVCKAGAKNVWVCEVYDMLLVFPEERTNGAYDPLQATGLPMCCIVTYDTVMVRVVCTCMQHT